MAGDAAEVDQLLAHWCTIAMLATRSTHLWCTNGAFGTATMVRSLEDSLAHAAPCGHQWSSASLNMPRRAGATFSPKSSLL